MIALSLTLQNLLAQRNAEPFYTVLITTVDGLSTLYNSTTHSYDIQFSNGETYTSDALVVGLEPPRLSSNVDREQYKIALGDPSFTQSPNAENGMVGKRILIRAGFIDQSTGMPLLDVNDTIIIYKGRIEGCSLEVHTEEIGEVVLNLSCSSPMADLDMKKGLYLSKDKVRGRNPNDSSCDRVYDGSGATLKWGKL